MKYFNKETMGITMRKKTALDYRLLAVLLFGILTGAAWAQAPADQLEVYPAPAGLPPSTDFSVKVRTPGKPWQDVPAIFVKVAKVVDAKTTPQDTSIAAFDFAGTAEVSITSNRGPIAEARVRPLSCGIKPQVTGNTIAFTLTQPRNLSVEVGGDIFHNLQLFANPLETARPKPTDANVIYYGPGLHQVGRVRVASGQTVYVAGGAVVRGQFTINNVDNVHFRGRGILLDCPLHFDYSKDCELEGLILAPGNVQAGCSKNLAVRNIKSFSSAGWGDGLDVYCSDGVLIDGVFMRNSDDCIAIYAHRNRYYGDVKNVTVKNSTLWADVAHPILVGTHGDSQNPDMLDGLAFSNLDILDHHEAQVDYQGCLSLNAGDSNLIRNVRFENIRVEDFREGQLVNLRVMFNRKYNTSPGRGIENVLFKDVTYNGGHANLSVIAGYDDTRGIKNVVFENLRINGRLITDTMPGKPAWYKTGDMARFFVGEHVEGLVFRAGVSAPATPK